MLRIVTFGQQPLPVDDELIATLRHHATASEENSVNVYFKAGENVEITDGPFKNLQAVFANHKGEERAIVLLNLLNRQQRLEIPVASLRPES